jgi:hypothetical protein
MQLITFERSEVCSGSAPIRGASAGWTRALAIFNSGLMAST